MVVWVRQQREEGVVEVAVDPRKECVRLGKTPYQAPHQAAEEAEEEAVAQMGLY